jgi:NADH-quinone oxidoreductase subunit K
MPFNPQAVLIVAAILFVLGLVGVLTRKNIIFILVSIEIMLNAAGLAFVAAGARWGQADGQVMFLFILAMAASEVSVGLALVMQAYRQHKTLDVQELRELKDQPYQTIHHE